MFSPFRNAIHNRLQSHNTNPPNQPTNLTFHDLTPGAIAPPLTNSVLGLGSKFIVAPKSTTRDITTNISRLDRDFKLRVFFAGPKDPLDPFTTRTSKLYVPSTWLPKCSDTPYWVDARLSKFFARVKKLFHSRQARRNILSYQERVLQELLDNRSLLFPDTDKGLGPCAVTYDQYVADALCHLRDPSIHQQLSSSEAHLLADNAASAIESWTTDFKDVLDPMDTSYIHHQLAKNSSSPFAQFYILYKIHKPKKADGRWSTRPVTSDITSYPHGLGKWVDQALQPLARKQPSFFKDSFELKAMLSELSLPNNSLLFTADATSMYTNIKTDAALTAISQYIREEFRTHPSPTYTQALISALHIVFNNSIVKFGDTYWRQISGTGMGIAPAPPWATIFYSLHEQTFVPQWEKHLIFYKRFIDDILGIWLPHPHPKTDALLWSQFMHSLQLWHDLEWTLSSQSQTCNFMDLHLTSSPTGKIETNLFEKSQNLYLYIPPGYSPKRHD